MDWPCHSKPQSEWCDREGPGGFMGHTCKTTARIVAQSRLRAAERDFSAAENELHEANMKLENARESFAAVNK